MVCLKSFPILISLGKKMQNREKVYITESPGPMYQSFDTTTKIIRF